jgi:methylated-DNA-[protein]-cysteine S-methyltransferase
LGTLAIFGEAGAIASLSFARDGEALSFDGEHSPLLERCARELDRYFAGTLTVFTVPLAFRGTPFQLAVWEALRAIPHGKTASYGEVARSIGKPGAARAVGMACNRNPIAIIVPCHRVVGSSGALAGYAGGPERKRFLLELEARSAFMHA